ncbi:hypothetical protein [Thermococcus sp.]|uniref:hypothetical protein n=1 Tax=Thermococcus sp. TaxID=35749 RepID=UPI0025EF5087|nr:hypothetical protein [Thermococcus sp.]
MGVIYGILLSIPEKLVGRYGERARRAIGAAIARGDVITFTWAEYRGDLAFVMLAGSREGAERTLTELSEMPVYVKIIGIEGG